MAKLFKQTFWINMGKSGQELGWYNLRGKKNKTKQKTRLFIHDFDDVNALEIRYRDKFWTSCWSNHRGDTHTHTHTHTHKETHTQTQTHTQTHTHMHTFLYLGAAYSHPFSLICMFLDCGRKPTESDYIKIPPPTTKRARAPNWTENIPANLCTTVQKAVLLSNLLSVTRTTLLPLCSPLGSERCFYLCSGFPSIHTSGSIKELFSPFLRKQWLVAFCHGH